MTRLRWGLAALATVLAAVVGLFTYTTRPGSSDLARFGSGSLSASDLATTRSMLTSLSTPAGTTRDPYATACYGQAVVCLSSTLPRGTLLSSATAQLAAAGATLLAHTCPKDADCSARYEFHGVHIGADAGKAGPLTYLALRVADPAPTTAATVQRPGVLPSPSLALGSWASVNPMPASWLLTATCTKPSAKGCDAHENDWRNLTPIGSGITQAFAAAQKSLTDAGFRIDTAHCSPATPQHQALCTVAGARFRSVGGLDGMTALVSLRAIDAHHVTARVNVSAL